MIARATAFSLLVLLNATPLTAVRAQSGPIYSDLDRVHAQFAPTAMVATQEQNATRVGREILRAGGNAVDAAVAVGFALAVTLPRAGNLGGGGFMLVHDAGSATTHAIDYRETAPAAASRDMFLDDAGAVDSKRSRFSHASVATPGTVAGLSLALQRFGTMSLAEVVAPAIALAEDGFEVGLDLAASLGAHAERLAKNDAARRIFLDADGRALAVGHRLVQPDLARTLRAIAEDGVDAFYHGSIASAIAKDMAANGGVLSADDLARYAPVVRTPVFGSYRGHIVASMPPPSSGGVHLIQMLNVLEHFPIGFLGHNSADALHLMTETMKLAYADRAKHLGDPDFWPVPMPGLVSKRYAAALAKQIDLDRARPSREIVAGEPARYESNETTHYSVMDGDGNVVSNTYTINFAYGSGIVAPGTGVLLNNEMDDFSAKPGVANAYGLVGGDANAIEPGKRPLSSMTPTIVFKDGKPLLATGTPGGSRIITTTLQVIMNVIDHDLRLATAVSAPRIHHQWLPDELRVEQGLSPDTLNLLRTRGHRVVQAGAMGSANSVMRVPGGVLGMADPRRPGALAAGL